MKKNIALITKGFTGSVLPLAKAFVEKGYFVDVYLFNYICIHDLEAFDCEYRSEKFGIEEIKPEKWKDAYEYFEYADSIRFFSLKMPRPYLSVPLLRSVLSIFSLLYVNKVCSTINSKKYCFVNFVCGYYSSEYLPFMQRINSKQVVSLHEVCDHFHPRFDKPTKLLKYLFENHTDCIVYSDNSLKDILKYGGADASKIHRVNFGLFESFKTFHIKNTFDLPSTFVLFFGSILPYKGLSVLYSAIKMLDVNMQFVIAGKGEDPKLQELAGLPNVTVIHKRLTNAELCELISKSSLVVCPYLTMSQSGIPQTVFTFGKPIIASDLDGFKEIITPNENGILFRCGDAAGLAKGIKCFFSDTNLAKGLRDGALKIESEHPEFSWKIIVDYYIEHFCG